jgi:hypothetical protein
MQIWAKAPFCKIITDAYFTPFLFNGLFCQKAHRTKIKLGKQVEITILVSYVYANSDLCIDKIGVPKIPGSILILGRERKAHEQCANEEVDSHGLRVYGVFRLERI